MQSIPDGHPMTEDRPPYQTDSERRVPRPQAPASPFSGTVHRFGQDSASQRLTDALTRCQALAGAGKSYAARYLPLIDAMLAMGAAEVQAAQGRADVREAEDHLGNLRAGANVAEGQVRVARARYLELWMEAFGVGLVG